MNKEISKPAKNSLNAKIQYVSVRSINIGYLATFDGWFEDKC